MRVILFAFLFGGFSLHTAAQKASFIYIQGDKKTPFYVKLDGEMQPRYGKNYCIIPELTPGFVDVELLFQQNAFPAQKFKVKVPEGGQRSFLIIEKSAEISLYDLEQEFYLPAGNKAAEDRLPNIVPTVASTAREPFLAPGTNPVRTTQAREERNSEIRPEKARTVTVRQRPKSANSTSVQTNNPAEPNFIPNLSLGTGDASPNTANQGASCGVAMDVQAFASLYRRALDISDQNDRLVFLGNQSDGCYSPTQLRLLARVLDRDAARYTFLKKIQPRVTVRARFGELEDLLASEAYRARFRELL